MNFAKTLCLAGLVLAAVAASASARSVTMVKRTTGETMRLPLDKFAKEPGTMVEFVRGMVAQQRAKCSGEQDTECLAGCIKKLNKFDGEACFGLEPDQTFLEHGFDKFDTIMPNFDEVTNAELDEFCPCTGKIKSLFRTMLSVISCAGFDLGGTDSDEAGESFTPEKVVDLFEVMIDFMCIKNGNNYCQVIAQTPEVNVDGINSDSNATALCPGVTALGCCTASLLELVESDKFKDLVGGDAGEVDGISEIRNILTECGLGEVEPCLKPGESAIFTQATFRIDADFSVISNNDTKLTEFKAGFAKDVAKPLGISPLQVEILNVTEGSVVVETRIRGDIEEELNTAVSAGISLNNTRSAVSDYEDVEDVSASDVSAVGTASVENEADPSPASAFGPSFFLLAAAALAALLL